MAEVTGIRQPYRGTHRRRVFLDDEEWRVLPAEVVKDVGLREGASVERAAIEERVDASLPVQAWERVLRLLNFRERGTGELERRLSEDGYPDHVAACAIARAVDLGFLDDRRFADSLVRGCVSRGLGRRRIAQELSSKGVDDGLAQEVLSGYCGASRERERALGLARRLVGLGQCDPAKLARRLVGKGYETGVALDAAREACDPSASDRDA